MSYNHLKRFAFESVGFVNHSTVLKREASPECSLEHYILERNERNTDSLILHLNAFGPDRTNSRIATRRLAC